MFNLKSQGQTKTKINTKIHTLHAATNKLWRSAICAPFCKRKLVISKWPFYFFFSKQTNKQHGQYKIISKKVNFITEAAQQSSFWLSLVISTPFSKKSFTISKHPIFIIEKKNVKTHFDNNLQQTNQKRKRKRKRKNSILDKPSKAECDQSRLDN